jgi:hypothetical protein
MSPHFEAFNPLQEMFGTRTENSIGWVCQKRTCSASGINFLGCGVSGVSANCGGARAVRRLFSATHVLFRTRPRVLGQ